jgi:uncharacterized protein YktB (UPF0637 family)
MINERFLEVNSNMNFTGFTEKDFNVFTIDGLDQRMSAIKEVIRPKFEELGTYFTPILTALSGNEMFFHIAKHARRTVNPPKDTWISWAANKRGYKMVPHFQVGLWNTHLFVWFAIIYEAPVKGQFAEQMLRNIDSIHSQIPDSFYWSWDHTKPESISQNTLSKKDLENAFCRLRDIKKAELLCGIRIDREDPLLQEPESLLNRLEDTFKILMPLYTIRNPHQ